MAFDPNQKEDDGDIDLVLHGAQDELIAMKCSCVNYYHIFVLHYK